MKAYLSALKMIAGGILLMIHCASAQVNPNSLAADTTYAIHLLQETKSLMAAGQPDSARNLAFTVKNMLDSLLGPDSYQSSRALYVIGSTYYREGRFAEAKDAWKKSNFIQRKTLPAGHPFIVNGTFNLGICSYELGEYEESVGYLQTCVEMYTRSVGAESEDVSDCYLAMGKNYLELGAFDKTLDLYQKALAIRLGLFGENSSQVAESYNCLGIYYEYAGDYDQSSVYNQKTLRIRMQLNGPDHPAVASCYINIALNCYSKNDYDRALWYNEQALKIRMKAFGEKHPEVAKAYGNLAITYLAKGEFVEAVRCSERDVLIGQEALGPEHPTVAEAYNMLGECLLAKGELDSALLCQQRALQIWQKNFGSDHRMTATGYSAIGACYDAKGDWLHAIEATEKAVGILAKKYAPTYPALVEAHNALGNYWLQAGNIEKAEAQCQSAFSGNQNGETDIENVFTLSKAINNWSLEGDIRLAEFAFKKDPASVRLALSDYQNALRLIDYQRQLNSGNTSRELEKRETRVLEGNIGSALILHQLTENVDYLADAFSCSERSKSRRLLESLRETEALRIGGIPDSLIQQESRLRADITWAEKKKEKLSESGLSATDTSVLALSDRVFKKQQQYVALKNELSRNYPDYFRLINAGKGVNLHELQTKVLRPGQCLLEYCIGDHTIYLFAIRPDQSAVFEIKKDFPLEDWVKQIRAATTDGRSTGAVRYADLAFRLYVKLVLPAEKLLSPEIIIVPDGVLSYLPFEILLREKPEKPNRFSAHAYFLRDHAIQYAYSATLLYEMGQRGQLQAPGIPFAAFAPFYDGDTTLLSHRFGDNLAMRKDLSPLPGSGEEAFQAAKIMHGQSYLGEAATVSRFLQIAGNCRILHLATHGQASDQSGDYAFLAFHTPNDSLETGLLFVRDLYNLQLNADLVVLSACETGMGQLRRGEGIVSLARAFAYAGARGIVTSLWSVNDARTKELMLSFYQNLQKGMPGSEALRQAKLSMIRKGNESGHPFFWAGFIGIGDLK